MKIITKSEAETNNNLLTAIVFKRCAECRGEITGDYIIIEHDFIFDNGYFICSDKCEKKFLLKKKLEKI